MFEQLKKSGTRLAIGLILLFTLVGLYMCTMRLGFLYRTVDGYLLVLPIARLGLTVVIVGLLLGLSGAVSESAVDSWGSLFKKNTWAPEDGIPRIIKRLLRYPLLVGALVAGYFMLKTKVSSVVSPLGGYGWVSVVFGLLWLAAGIGVLVFFAVKLKSAIPELRQLRAERRALRVSRAKAPSAVSAGRPGVKLPYAPSPTPVKVPGTAASESRAFCKKCGAELEPGRQFCKRCGERTE